MALFEQRISDEQVQVARRAIDAGEASLRAAAAAIPCAPSTLSERIKKLKAAEADALARAGIGVKAPRGSRRARTDPDRPAGAGEGDAGPIEVLRGAMQATKSNGQPDWPTRLSAARALAALRPEELEPKEEEQAAATVVYDLPPGRAPILHRARSGAEAPAGDTATRMEPLPAPGVYMLTQGDENTPLVEHALSGGIVHVHFLTSRDEAAELLRAFGGDPACLDTAPDAEPQVETG